MLISDYEEHFYFKKKKKKSGEQELSEHLLTKHKPSVTKCFASLCFIQLQWAIWQFKHTLKQGSDKWFTIKISVQPVCLIPRCGSVFKAQWKEIQAGPWQKITKAACWQDPVLMLLVVVYFVTRISQDHQ